MKTMKWLKRAKGIFQVYLFFCFIAVMAFFLHSRTWNDIFMCVGLFSTFAGIVNPLPVVFSAIGIGCYVFERRDAEVRNMLGKQWLLFPVIIVLSVAAFLIACWLTVVLTGGV